VIDDAHRLERQTLSEVATTATQLSKRSGMVVPA
jgi:hypothetical protein